MSQKLYLTRAGLLAISGIIIAIAIFTSLSYFVDIRLNPCSNEMLMETCQRLKYCEAEYEGSSFSITKKPEYKGCKQNSFPSYLAKKSSDIWISDNLTLSITAISIMLPFIVYSYIKKREGIILWKTFIIDTLIFLGIITFIIFILLESSIM